MLHIRAFHGILNLLFFHMPNIYPKLEIRCHAFV